MGGRGGVLERRPRSFKVKIRVSESGQEISPLFFLRNRGYFYQLLPPIPLRS